MGNLVWLVLAVPQWYFSSVLAPFSGGPITLIPTIGVICLPIGLFFARKSPMILWHYLFLFFAAEAFVGFAGFNRGELDNSVYEPATTAFISFVALYCLALYFLKRKNWRVNIPLTIFSITFALFASFVAMMSFSDSWI